MAESLDECVDRIKPLLEAEPEDMAYRSLYAVAINNKAQLAANRGEWAQSRMWQLQVMELRERMVLDEPDNVVHFGELIQTHADLAVVATALNEPSETELHFQRMRELFARLEPGAMNDPRVAGVYQMVCQDHVQPAGLCDRGKAVESARRGVETGGRRNPSRYYNLAVTLISVGDMPEAIRAAEQGLALIPSGDSPTRAGLEKIRDEAMARLRNTLEPVANHPRE